MGLAQSQALLARLATDRPFRESFYRDPHGVGLALGLSREEAALLAQLPARPVARFAAALRNKRYLEVRKLLPLSHLALGDAAFARLFDRHADSFVPAGVHKHSDDALAFAHHAEHAVRSGKAGPEWPADALRYEAARLLAGDAGRCCIVRRLRYSRTQIISSAQSRQEPVRSRGTLAIWFRISPEARLRHVTISWPGRPRAPRLTVASTEH